MSRARTDRSARLVLQWVNLLLALIVLSIGLVVVVAGPAEAEQFATLHPLTGTVEVAEGGDEFREGRDGQVLSAGDTIRTGADGRAEIEYFDESLTRLDYNTTFTLEELSSDPDVPGSKTILADQEQGRTFERVVAITDSESRFETETPTATASVLGTTYVLFETPDGTLALWVLPDEEDEDGEVVLVLEDGTEIVVREGEGVVVFPDGTVGETFPLTDEHLLDPWVLFNNCDLDELNLPACEEPEDPIDPIDPEDPEDPQDPDEGKPEPTPPAPPSFTSGGTTTTTTTTTGDGGGDDDGPSDTTPPKTTITAAPQQFTKARDATFRFRANEPVSFFQCSLDGGSYSRCSSGRTYTGLGDGTHQFRVRATDTSGNRENTATHQWTIDTVAPTTTITEGPETEAVGRSTSSSSGGGGGGPTFEFESNESPNVTFECRLDEGGWARCTSPHQEQPVENGDHTFYARATDRAGNTGEPDEWSWCQGDYTDCFGEFEREPGTTSSTATSAGQPPTETTTGQIEGAVQETVQQAVDAVTDTVEEVREEVEEDPPLPDLIGDLLPKRRDLATP